MTNQCYELSQTSDEKLSQFDVFDEFISYF
jgi:hypothetical protein